MTENPESKEKEMNGRPLVLITMTVGLTLPAGGQSLAREGTGSRSGGASTPVLAAEPVARIPFRSIGGLIFIPVRVNGARELNMILDTGMSAPIVMLMHRESSDELHLEGGQPVRIGGAGGAAVPEGRLFTGGTVTLGGIELPQQTLIVMDASRDSSTWLQDGVIGKSVFDRYVVDIDFERSVLSLYEPAAFEARGFQSVPLSLSTGLPILEARVENGKGEEIPVRLVLDLGAGHALSLHPDPARHLDLPARTVSTVIGKGIQGEIEGQIGRVLSLRVGPFTFASVVSSFASKESGVACANQGSGADGNLGIRVLRRFRVVLDYARKRILLAPRPGHDGPFELNMAGLVLRVQKDGSLLVRSVIEGSSGAEAGLASGDRVVAIDGRDLDFAGQVDSPELFMKEGPPLRLTVERGGERFERAVPLRRAI